MTASVTPIYDAPPPTHSPAWHDERRNGIGSSEIATIAGIGRWGSRYALWLEKTGRTTPDRREASEAMDTGRELEPWLASQAEKRTGLIAAGEQMMLRHPEEQWARTTIDAVLIESPDSTLDDAVAALELKYDDHRPWCEDCDRTQVCVHPVVPDYYAAQAQWHMFVGGWPCVFFGVLHSYGRYRIYRLDRDENDIRALVSAGRWFWNLVQTDTAPPVDGSQATADAIAAAYPPDGSTADIDDLADTIASLREAKAAIKHLKDEAAAYENALKEALGSAVVGRIDGRDVVTWKEYERAGFTVNPTTVRPLLIAKERKPA